MTYQITLTDYNLIVSKMLKSSHEEFIIPKENVLTISAEQKDIADSLSKPKTHIDAQDLGKAIVITLKNEPYEGLVIEVSDPKRVISKLRASINN